MVVTLSKEQWGLVERKATMWDDEMAALKKGEIVFVPYGERRPDTLRIMLYEAAKRIGLKASVRSYTHEGVDGFAVKARS